MRRVNLFRTLSFLCLVLAGRPAQGLDVDHTPAACALEGRFPRIEVRLKEGSQPSSIQVYFHRTEDRDWYAVRLRPEGATWTAELPAPEAGLRFGYFIDAREGERRARAPETSAFLVDVAPACPEGALPTSAAGPVELRVPPGAPRVPAGFARQGIGSYVEYTTDQVMPSAAAPRSEWLGVREGTRVRIRRTGSTKGDGELVEGTVASWGADGPLLQLDRKKTLRLRNEEVAEVQVRQPGSPAIAALGGLAGAAAGFVGAVLVCVSVDGMCDSVGPLWVGTGLGMAVGISAGGSSSWKRVPLARRGAFALEVERPREGAAAVGLSVRF